MAEDGKLENPFSDEVMEKAILPILIVKLVKLMEK